MSERKDLRQTARELPPRCVFTANLRGAAGTFDLEEGIYRPSAYGPGHVALDGDLAYPCMKVDLSTYSRPRGMIARASRLAVTQKGIWVERVALDARGRELAPRLATEQEVEGLIEALDVATGEHFPTNPLMLRDALREYFEKEQARMSEGPLPWLESIH
jgi:hypothetical protein